jgi:hypothetical protein
MTSSPVSIATASTGLPLHAPLIVIAVVMLLLVEEEPLATTIERDTTASSAAIDGGPISSDRTTPSLPAPVVVGSAVRWLSAARAQPAVDR